MAKNILVGVNNIAKKPKNIYVGVNNKARKVKAVYVGVNGIAKQCWPAGILPSGYTQLEYLDQIIGVNTDVKVMLKPRIVMEFSVVNNSFDYNGSIYFISADSRIGYTSGNYCNYNFYLYANDGYFLCNASSWNENSDSYSYGVNYTSNKTEKTLLNTTYRLDFFNGDNVYFYNTEGYYSITSHNLLGSISRQSLVTGSEHTEGVIILNAGINLSSGLIKSFGMKMYNGSTLIRDYYPCYRNSDKYLGYYDTVNRVFYPGYLSILHTYPQTIKYDYAIENGYLVGPVV